MPAPNETLEQEARKNELFALQTKRELSMAELLELRELTRIARSHLQFTRIPATLTKESRS